MESYRYPPASEAMVAPRLPRGVSGNLAVVVLANSSVADSPPLAKLLRTPRARPVRNGRT